MGQGLGLVEGVVSEEPVPSRGLGRGFGCWGFEQLRCWETWGAAVGAPGLWRADVQQRGDLQAPETLRCSSAVVY